MWQQAPILALAREARDGNERSAQALDAFTIRITDADGNLYWPLA
jgi:hypothetical protein